MTARLILFTRFPRPGSAKSRLIPTLGSEGAAALHRELTEHTLRTVDQSLVSVGFDLQVRYTGASPEEMSDWLGAHRICVPQGDGDLGTRMEAAVQDAFAESMERVVVIGADCPDLSPEILKRSFDLLIRSDVVIGPALDGGYYLVAVRRSAWERCRRPLFSNMPWGTDEVLTETLRRAHSTGLELARLDVLGDVDRPEDLIVWERARENKH
jgi:rSAM/selenodomain-associated transferase 1